MAGATPRDAASLIVYRHRDKRLQTLMGKRSERAKFAPGIYVFPGGNVEQVDKSVDTPHCFDAQDLTGRDDSKLPTLAITAIRETWEETGVMVGVEGKVDGTGSPAWAAFESSGLVPAPHKLHYIGRAITPMYSPTRYHARFFATEWKNCEGEIKGGGELSNLRWVDATNPENLPMYDVTEYMLEQLNKMLNSQETRNLVVSYRLNETLLRYE